MSRLVARGPRLGLRTLTAAAALGLLALPTTGCLDHPLKEVQYETIGVVSDPLPVDPRRKVDILFVIDNSGSMGEEQATLAANFSTFVEALERDDVDADYRIGITTTDNGNLFCGGTGPEAGALQMRSCRAHIDDFVFSPGTNAEIDRTDAACLQGCPESLADLQPLPTTTDDDDTPRVRPWLERGIGYGNVPEGVDTAQALACWGPQGINGCGFESPLESMYKALVRSGRDGEDGQGFLRDDALLQVVFITDEADCSLGPEGDDAFDPDGAQTFWPDPTAGLPPSALCWSAGVGCWTGEDGRTQCDPVDLNADGEPAAEGEEVLHPLSRYYEILDQIDQHKRAAIGQDEPQVLVSVIAGVPSEYDGSPIDYQPGGESTFAQTYGVQPGCSSANGEAVPPVRLAAVAEAYAEQPGSNLFSICDPDYRPALDAIADRLIERLRPSCVEACVAGVGELTDGSLPTCTVTQHDEAGSRTVPTCTLAADGSWARPEGEALCVYAVTGDDRHEACVENDRNVELRFLRAPGASFGEVDVACEVSDTPRLDCPPAG